MPRANLLHARANIEYPASKNSGVCGSAPFGDAERLTGKDQVGIADLIPVRFEDPREQARVAVFGRSNARQRVTRLDGVHTEPEVTRYQVRSEDHRDDHGIVGRSLPATGVEDLDKASRLSAVVREGRR